VEIVANVVVAAIALLHVYILVLEMFLWTTPVGRRAFGLKPEFAQESAALAANQGLYNGFLAAGLVWGLVAGGSVGFQAKVFFLVCVLVAGVYGYPFVPIAFTMEDDSIELLDGPQIVAVGMAVVEHVAACRAAHMAVSGLLKAATSRTELASVNLHEGYP